MRLLQDAGFEVEKLSGTVGEQLRQSVASRADIIVVDGGDGTIRAAIEAHRGDHRPIGLLPGGTMNLLATDYGIPEDRAEAAAVIAAGHRRRVDVGLIGGRIFLHTALTGLPVRMGVHREHRRGRLGALSKIGLAIHALTTLPRDPVLTVEATLADGSADTLKSPSFALVVGQLESGLLPRPQRGAISGGVFTLFAISPKTTVDVARMMVTGALGDLADDRSVERRIIRAATIAGPRRKMHAMLDGESALLSAPCTVEILDEKVEVFAPESAVVRAGTGAQ